MASNHWQTMEEKTSMTSVLLASGVPEPRQVQVFTRAGSRQGGQTLDQGREHPGPNPENAELAPRDAGGGSGPPTSQSSEFTTGVYDVMHFLVSGRRVWHIFLRHFYNSQTSFN